MSPNPPNRQYHGPSGNTTNIPVDGPQFSEPTWSPDPKKFVVNHGSDKEAYTILDHEKGQPALLIPSNSVATLIDTIRVAPLLQMKASV